MGTNPSGIFKLSALPDEAQGDWELFCEAYEESKGKKFDLTPPQAPLFLKIFGNSRFLSAFVRRHPLLVDAVLSSPYLHLKKPFDVFSSELTSVCHPELKRRVPRGLSGVPSLRSGHALVSPQNDGQAWLNQIRIYKYQELLRITLKDLQENRDEEVLAELSCLAYAILQTLDRNLLADSVRHGDLPVGQAGNPCAHAVIALGKMGGFELNYSSDIDLIALYETDDVAALSPNPHEFYTRHIQVLTQALQNPTEEGFLYRVDWDLRPEGGAGTLVSSLASMEVYYETFGAWWERQAMTKATPAAGSQKLGEEFTKMILPFVYRKHLDVEAIGQIRATSERIHEDQSRKKNQGFNVKLGIGGLREIEFFVQSFLLIYGGKKPEIRHANTLHALGLLEKNSLLHKRDSHFLREAYLFLRKVEHRLQMENEAQTHVIPLKEKDQAALARRMGYGKLGLEEAHARFKGELKKYTEGVHHIFSGLFAETTFYLPATSLARREDFSPEILRTALSKKLGKASDFEEKLERFHLFKKEEQKKIGELEHQPAVSRQEILLRLSLLAEVICKEALQFASDELKSRFGAPSSHSAEEKTEAALVVFGMGKLGGQEIGYASDLDMIFIYSENGETSGPQKISNAEYFARLVQKFIFLLSVPTREGWAYQIDTELRPSGHAGPLVTSLENFVDYQRKNSQIWERQSLLRARPIAGFGPVARLISGHIRAFLFSAPYPAAISREMHRLRLRVERETAREDKRHFDLKLGKGGVMDIEFILQYQQLLHASLHEDFRQHNTFEGLDKLMELNFLKNETDAVALKEIYVFYRTLESKIALARNRSIHRLNLNDTLLDEVAPLLPNTPSRQELLEEIMESRERVRGIYSGVFLETKK